MADEKHPLTDNKPGESDGIPAPVVAATPPPRRRVGAARMLAQVFALVLAFTVWQWSLSMFEEMKHLDDMQGRLLAKAFGGKGARPKGLPLYGKASEKLFLTIPNPASAIAASRQYATKPHMAGTEGDFETAKYFLALLQQELGAVSPSADASSEPIFSAGSESSRNATLSITSLKEPTAWIDVYYPVMNTPLDRSLEILNEDGSVHWSAELEEVADETDPEAGEYYDAVPAWHGLSRGGEAKGKLIYANYGRKQDYDELVERGVDFTGSIVICRYGGVFRGLKVKAAEELGAAGVLIYSDPRDDGTVTEENGYIPYPDGPARSPQSVQRGSVQYLSIYPGDPTTPGYPSYENITRTDGENIPKIPSLPISWANAEVLLELITHPDNEDKVVSLVNHVDDRVIPIWNTMGVIPGHIKDEVVVVGNHRDAWVMGASDPSSGTVSTHEAIRGFGALLKAGWRPLRTIVFASWDAEEYGLIGSTEWGEDFADWISEHVVTYVNLDGSVSGSRFGASGSPSLAHFLRAIAEELPHPTKPGLTLWDATKDRGVLTGDKLDAEAVRIAEEAEKADGLGVGVLGSGSDFTVFLQRLGVASSDHGFKSTLTDPVYHYHSVFDSQRWQEIYADPGFLRHVVVAKYVGLQTLRLADAIVLPINTTYYSEQLQVYLDGVEEIALTSDVDVDFASLHNSIENLIAASTELDNEKAEAEHELKKVLRRIGRRHVIRKHLHKVWCRLKGIFGKECHKPGEHDREAALEHAHHMEHAAHRTMHHPKQPVDGDAVSLENKPKHKPGKKLKHKLRKAICKVKGIFGKPCHKHDDLDEPDHSEHPAAGELQMADDTPVRPRVGHWAAMRKEQEGQKGCHAHARAHGKGKLPKKLEKRLKKAAHRVREVNKKLVAFEKGFIHEDGIKDRQWYRHLGVAPGKWLGYGATTLPALTESITIEKNGTLAQYEAARLKGLIDHLAEVIEP